MTLTTREKGLMIGQDNLEEQIQQMEKEIEQEALMYERLDRQNERKQKRLEKQERKRQRSAEKKNALAIERSENRLLDSEYKSRA